MSISVNQLEVLLSLKSLRQLKPFTPYHMRKNLAEALVLIKLDYTNAFFITYRSTVKTRCREYRMLRLVLFNPKETVAFNSL